MRAAAIVVPVAQGMDGGMGMGWGIAMMAVMLLLVVLAVVGGIWLARRLIGGRDASRADDRPVEDALQLLERRFAEGEIDDEEYRQRRSTLVRGR